MRSKLSCLALCGLAALAAGPAAADKLADVLARGKLIVGTGSTNPPWHFRDESGNLVGFDVIRELALDGAKSGPGGPFEPFEKIDFREQHRDVGGKRQHRRRD